MSTKKETITPQDAKTRVKENLEEQKVENKGRFVIQIETKEGRRWTGPGKDWLVRDQEKAQIYKTRNGAQRWIEKFAKAQGDATIQIA